MLDRWSGLRITTTIKLFPDRELHAQLDALVDLIEALLDPVEPSGNTVDDFSQPMEIAAEGCRFRSEIVQPLRNRNNRPDTLAYTPNTRSL